MPETAFRTCPLCEATCGLELTLDGDRITAIRGDKADVFSHGFICPKGPALKELHHDPDRLRRPLIRAADGTHREASWDEAWQRLEAGLRPVVDRYGRNAVALYLGNPTVHNLGGMVYVRPLLKALGTRNVFSASTVDQMPKHLSCALMYGHPRTIPVPDLDRTHYLLILGANPWVSNGSLCTAPDFPGRVKGIRARGGKVVVVDPRRTRTAKKADEHLFIRPGTDAFLLLGIAATLFEENRATLGAAAPLVTGLDRVREVAARFPAEVVAPPCGIPADTIRRLARELSEAPTAAVYGRIGTCTVPYGSVTSWLVDVVNILTGNLDRPGGILFPRSAHARHRPGVPPGGKGYQIGRWTSRVRQLPEVMGELPVAALAEEIDTPGDGQIRALVTVAGNPVLSTPNGNRLERALGGLDFMVSIDPYLNETTRHADVILPVPSPVARGHYDIALYDLAVRHVAHYSPPSLPRDAGMPDEWEVLAKLSLIAAGQGAAADPAFLDELVIQQVIRDELAAAGSPLHGRNAGELLAALAPRKGPERVVDFLLRSGPYGDHFDVHQNGLTLARLEAEPHGIDFGPLEPRLADVLRTASGKVELAPDALVADLARLDAALQSPANGHLVLVGRRQLRSNNSWMHNLPTLVRGKPRCTLQVHPRDAERLGLVDGSSARVTSRVGQLVAPVEVTEGVMPGVVSLPHGWGHDQDGTALHVAREHAGVCSNVLADELAIDPLSGNAVLNGIPVDVRWSHD